MADTLEQLTKKLLDEQVAANKKEAADRQLQKIKDTNEINKQNKILEELDTKLIENLQEQLKNADKKDKELIESLGKQLKDAGVDKFMEATSRIESIEESQKFSKKVEATRSKDMQRIDAMKTSVERMKDEVVARGEDASKIGELDQWGGHCGKADDYHYHLPPTHLSEIVGENNPIAYSLDGFPIYGTTSKTLDENLGILNSDGSYHYHTINEYPYFIANMKGKVTLSGSAPENQIVPQPKTIPIRPSLTPLNGAEITDFIKTSENSYTLTYTINTEIYSINYSWDNTGHYYFTFTDPQGNSITETYHN